MTTAFLLFWPTALWMLGLTEFWFDLLTGHRKQTIGWGPALAVTAGILTAFSYRRGLAEALRVRWGEIRVAPLLFKILLAIAILLIGIGLFESRHPPHLVQETDSQVYHMSLPRQHLMRGDWRLQRWSAADLWPMPLQWGFASTWFMGKTINKWPQGLIAIWVFLVMVELGRYVRPADGTEGADGRYAAWTPAIAFMTSHGVMIQLGTGMMDLSNLYCLLAGLYCARRGWPVWMALHLAIFATAKAFHPLLFAGVLTVTVTFYGIFHREALRTSLSALKPAIPYFALFFTLLIARSAAVALPRAGTPLFPFAVCSTPAAGCVGEAGVEIRASAAEQIDTRDSYGEGRGVAAFLKHLWATSVPTAGVNNAYDYPLGLPWLLWVIFAAATLAGFGRRGSEIASVELIVSFAFWAAWWVGSQQSRWLFPVIALGWLATQPIQRRLPPRLLLGLLVVSAAFSLLSMIRSEGPLLTASSSEIQLAETRNVARDPSTGFVSGLKTLYAEEQIYSHAPGNKEWFLEY